MELIKSGFPFTGTFSSTSVWSRGQQFHQENFMDPEINLPFKIGDLAEARTFEEGYRDAWFRCKIIEICKREGSIGHISEYYDFPDDEKLEWAKFYQMTPYSVRRSRESKIQLMLRPPYPPIFSKSQMPLVSEISEVTVIVDDAWKVGDLVDWWTTGCYWSGRIAELLGDRKAKLKLRKPPHGEGGEAYDVLYKDLRPSLDWSLERGWTVPTQGGKHGRVCARIIKPLNQGQEDSVHGKDESEDDRTPNTRTQGSGDIRMSETPNTQTQGSEDVRMSETPNTQTQGSEDIRTSETPNTQTQGPEDIRASKLPEVPHEKHGGGGKVTLNSVETDTLEAAIMELEELVNKVKWIKKILEQGVSFSDSVKPEWKFVEQAPSSWAPPK